MLRWILIGLLVLTSIGTGYWGYQEHQEKNAILVQAENNYQRAFHELSYRLDLLHDKIGMTLAMNSKDRLSPQLVEIWRLTSEAHADVGQLPLSLMPFNKTEEFLSNIGDFTYRTAVRDLETNPLTEDEMNTLKELYKQAGEIKHELRQVQHLALKNNLRWMDVQLALANQDDPADNTIIDGFKTVEKKVEGYAEAHAQSGIIGTSTRQSSYEFLTGQEIDEEEAIKISKKLLNVTEEADISISKSGDGADIPVYSASYEKDGQHGYIDLTVKGGHPLTILVNREIGEQTISLNEGLLLAQAYLEEFNFDHMTVFNSAQYDHVGVYSFLYQDGDIRVYSDKIEVKVALDNGDIIGLTTKDYLANHRKRDIQEPGISLDEAKDKVNPNVQIMEEFLAIIENEIGEEVLTYEFLGVLDDDTYRIFINAHDGREEKVEKLSGTEVLYSLNE